MKKLFLIFTFGIYIFSIFSEAGLLTPSHMEKKSVITLSDSPGDIPNEHDLLVDSDCSKCAGETCDVGHCHHTATLLARNFYEPDFRQILNSKLNSRSYQNPFLEGIKRPPKLF